MTPDAGIEGRDWQRLDWWLWCARFLRSRSAASRLCADGAVRINRVRTEKAHARLRRGDVLTFPQGDTVRVVQVVALAARRGPAVEARTLYLELEPQAGQDSTRSATDEGQGSGPEGLRDRSQGGI